MAKELSKLVLLPYVGGWEDVFLATSRQLLRSPTIPDSAAFDIAPHLSAYAKAGMTSPVLTTSMSLLAQLSSPRIVHTKEFDAALDECAAQLYTTLRLHSKKTRSRVVFLATTGVKSNLWVFLMLMHSIASNNAVGWVALRDHIHLGVYTGGGVDAGVGAGRGIHYTTLVATDDCAYSGSQLGYIAMSGNEELRPSRVVICPVYATQAALKLISGRIQLGSQAITTMCVPRIIGHAHTLPYSLGEADVAMCVRINPGPGRRGSRARPWMVFSMFTLLGVISQRISVVRKDQRSCWCDDMRMRDGYSNWFNGKDVKVVSQITGHAAIVFQHKIADMVSVPTQWFMLGPTLRHGVEKMNPILDSGGLSNTDVEFLPMRELMRRIDYNPLSPENRKPGRRWSVVTMFDGQTESTVSGACILMCDAKIVSPDTAAKKKQRKGQRPDLYKLPSFVPLLRPASACGTEFNETQRESSGDWWSAQQAHAMMWNLKDGTATKVKEDDELATSPCINAPYKAKLHRVIMGLVKHNKSLALAHTLGLTDR